MRCHAHAGSRSDLVPGSRPLDVSRGSLLSMKQLRACLSEPARITNAIRRCRTKTRMQRTTHSMLPVANL